MSVTPQPRTSERKVSRRLVIWASIALIVAVVAGWRGFTVEPRAPQPYLQGRVLVLAHQGASAYAPSNTIEAFKLALEQGADILELDVHMTKDGVIVASHDATIDRLTNGTGYINTMTLAELRKFDFGYKFTPDGGNTFPYRGKGVTIPTLAEVFEKFPGVRVNIELKQLDPTIEEQVWSVIAKYGMEQKVLVNAFGGEPMQRWADVMGRAGTQTATGASKPNMVEFVIYHLPHLDWMYHPKADAFQLPVSEKVGPITIRFDTKRVIERAHKLGMKVHYWTINDEATMRTLVSLGADGIITDRPDLAVKVLKDAGLR